MSDGLPPPNAIVPHDPAMTEIGNEIIGGIGAGAASSSSSAKLRPPVFPIKMALCGLDSVIFINSPMFDRTVFDHDYMYHIASQRRRAAMEPGGEGWRKAMKMGVKVNITRRPSQENDQTSSSMNQQQLQPPADWPKDTIGEMFCARHNLDTDETVYVTHNYAHRTARVGHLEEIFDPSRPSATASIGLALQHDEEEALKQFFQDLQVLHSFETAAENLVDCTSIAEVAEHAAQAIVHDINQLLAAREAQATALAAGTLSYTLFMHSHTLSSPLHTPIFCHHVLLPLFPTELALEASQAEGGVFEEPSQASLTISVVSQQDLGMASLDAGLSQVSKGSRTRRLTSCIDISSYILSIS